MDERKFFYAFLGEQLRAARKDRGWSLEKLVELTELGVSKTTIANIELGKQQISAYQLFKMIEVLKIPVEHILSSARRQIEPYSAYPENLKLTIDKL